MRSRSDRRIQVNNANTSLRLRGALTIGAAILLVNIVSMFSLGALFARQEGLGVGAAAARALHELARKLPPLLVGYAIGLVVVLVFLCRKPEAATTPVEAGRIAWQRLRSFVALSFLPFLLIAAAMMIYHLATGQCQDLYWILAFLFLVLGTVLVGHVLHRPNDERLYVLGTGGCRLGRYWQASCLTSQ